MKDYALQHEIGHSKHMDWKSTVMYMSASALPFIVAWATLRLMGLVLWGFLALLLGILFAPISWRYIRPSLFNKSEELADEYARSRVKMAGSQANTTREAKP
jgi:Zn-dependent protease with chaperone function